VSMTMPTDSAERKEIPLNDGLFAYCPAALAQVAMISAEGNRKHNPGEPMHHARGKSMDHGNCILRHHMDANDLVARRARGDDSREVALAIVYEKAQRAWRALMDLQQDCETLLGAPLAPGARLPESAP
jgi:hypothetical protein